MKYITGIFIGALIMIGGFSLAQVSVDSEVVAEPAIISDRLIDSKVQDIIASTTLDLAQATSVAYDQANNDIIGEKLDRIIDSLSVTNKLLYDLVKK